MRSEPESEWERRSPERLRNANQEIGVPGLTRREMLRLTSASLLAVGLDSAASAAEPAGFRFIVINDIHCRDERCHPWFQKIVASIRRHAPDFCLINGDLCE